MWNEKLVACARAYPTGVLTVVEPAGYPCSVRCVIQFDAAQQVMTIPQPPPVAAGWKGKACLLFHRHGAHLEDQHEMLIKGELVAGTGGLTFQPGEFLTGSGRPDTDRMPVAGSPVDIMRFMMLGRRKAREYLAKRGAPWTPRPWNQMLRYLDEHPAAPNR